MGVAVVGRRGWGQSGDLREPADMAHMHCIMACCEEAGEPIHFKLYWSIRLCISPLQRTNLLTWLLSKEVYLEGFLIDVVSVAKYAIYSGSSQLKVRTKRKLLLILLSSVLPWKRNGCGSSGHAGLGFSSDIYVAHGLWQKQSLWRCVRKAGRGGLCLRRWYVHRWSWQRALLFLCSRWYGRQEG